jgi:hypothetical protein
MYLEARCALFLPYRELIRVPGRPLKSLESLAFDGRWGQHEAVVEPDPTLVLVALSRTLRQLDPTGRLLLETSDMLLVESLNLEPDQPDQRPFPDAWLDGLGAGTLLFSGLAEGLHFSLRARMLTRVPLGTPALRLSLTAVPESLLAQAIPLSADDRRYRLELEHFFSKSASFTRLEQHLRSRGDRLVGRVRQALEPLADRPLEAQLRVHVAPETIAPELLRGLPDSTALYLEIAARELSRLRPSVEELYRVDEAGQLQVYRGQDRFFRRTEQEEVR